VSLAQAGDHPGDLPRLHVHHLHLGAVGDIEALALRPSSDSPSCPAAEIHVFLMKKGLPAARWPRRLLPARRHNQQAKGKQSLHRGQLLMSRCGIAPALVIFQFMDVFGFSVGISSGNGGFDLVILR